MTEYIKNQLIKLCDNPEWFNDMLNTWDFKPERESQAIKEYLSHVLLNGKLENTHIERIELQGRMVSVFIFDIPGDPVYFYIIAGVIDQNHNLTCILFRHHKPTFNPQTQLTYGTNHNNKRLPNRMGMARQSTSRGLYLAYRNILYHDR